MDSPMYTCWMHTDGGCAITLYDEDRYITNSIGNAHYYQHHTYLPAPSIPSYNLATQESSNSGENNDSSQ